MKRILARILSSDLCDDAANPSYYFSYSNEEAIREGDISTPHLTFIMAPKGDMDRPVKRGELVELTFCDNGALQIKHLPLKQRFDILQREMNLEGGYLKESGGRPLSAFEKVAGRFLELKKRVEKKRIGPIQQEFALHMAA